MSHPKELLTKHGLHPSKDRGQNFLTQPATALSIARSSGAGPGDWVVEIGPGLGALTLFLADLAAHVTAVEVDRGVHRALEGILAGHDSNNVELILGDALDIDWPDLLSRAGRPLKVVGNLPYVITSPLLFKLLENRASWDRATLMMQREVADRLGTGPGSKDWGRLSVLVQTYCRVEPGQAVSRRQFHPQPQVESRVMHLVPLAEPRVPLKSPEDEVSYSRLVKAAFSQRRKTLANSLAGGLGMERARAAEVLEGAGIDPMRRAETLSVEEMGRVWGAIK